MAEHITRGQIVRVVQKVSLRHPRGLTKEWVYSLLKPVVDALQKDLEEATALQDEPKTAPQDAATDATAGHAKNAAQPDLGDDPKKPAEEGGKKSNKATNKAKEKKK